MEDLSCDDDFAQLQADLLSKDETPQLIKHAAPGYPVTQNYSH